MVLPKPPPAKLSIAWVGNSFVYFNDLPSMLATLLLCAKPFPGTTVEYDSVAPGGQRFAGHADDTAVAGMLRRRAWDVVVLQDNSGVPGGYDSGRYAESAYALTDRLAPLTRDSLVCLLYGTWGHRFGSVYAEQQAAYPDYKTMQKLTTHGIDQYKRLLDRTQSCGAVGVAPVGDAWERIYDEDVRAKRDPLADDSLFSRLYKKDKFHPSVLGTFLAACVFALMILPEGSPIPEWRGDPRLDDEESEAVARLVTISKDDEHRLRAAALAAVGKRIDDGWVPNWVSDGGKVEL